MSRTTFKTFRIFILCLVLLFVALYSYEQKRASTSWYKTLEIVIYPINVDSSVEVDSYIKSLKSEDFYDIDRFTAKQAKKYKLILSKPTKIRLGETIYVLPPTPEGLSNHLGKSVLHNIIWSIKFRYWAWKNTPDDQSNLRRVRMFVLYHERSADKLLSHSYGLNKGLLAYVNAFAAKSQEGQNNIVIAHEFLHTVGATDKYDIEGEPIFPQGFAAPNLTNPYSQTKAEIMAGRIPISKNKSHMPNNLRSCLIGKQTAVEINWLQED